MMAHVKSSCCRQQVTKFRLSPFSLSDASCARLPAQTGLNESRIV